MFCSHSRILKLMHFFTTAIILGTTGLHNSKSCLQKSRWALEGSSNRKDFPTLFSHLELWNQIIMWLYNWDVYVCSRTAVYPYDSHPCHCFPNLFSWGKVSAMHLTSKETQGSQKILQLLYLQLWILKSYCINFRNLETLYNFRSSL